MITEEEFYAYPEYDEEDGEEKLKVKYFLKELEEVLLTRSDGIYVKIERDSQYPQHKGKDIITHVVIDTWDIAA